MRWTGRWAERQTRGGGGDARLDELHDDAERLLRMQEGLRPARIGLVATDDAESLGRRQRARRVQAGHDERDVMDARPQGRQKAMQESIITERLQDLQAAASCEAPLGPGVGARRPTVTRGGAPEDPFQYGRRVGQVGRGDGDVVEPDRARH
jgi:hypothetical protein